MSHKLNAGQELAARSLEGAVVVTAGAGSGKTRMLTERYINAVTPGAVAGWEPATVDQIVAITFTEKAAGEIAERVRIALREAGLKDEARRVDGAWLSTIHGLCSKLLRRHAFEAGVDPSFAVADTVSAAQLRADAFERSALRLVQGDPEVEALFDAYSYPQVFGAVLAIAHELEVRGLTHESIALEPCPAVERLFEAAQELLTCGNTVCDLYSGTAKSAFTFAEKCDALLGQVLELEAARHSAQDALSALAALFSGFKPLRSLKGIEGECEEIASRWEAFSGELGAALAAPHARALRALVAVYGNEYDSAKRAASVLDFEDLQRRAVDLLSGSPHVRERYRNAFRLVMIDEFQDTDSLQLALVEQLSDGNLCTVGDEKQSIYRFRGADIGVYRAHRADMARRGALGVELDVNYRSHPEVLAFVNAVFSSAEYFAGDLLRLVPPETEREPQRADEAIGSGPRIETIFVDRHGLSADRGRAAEARVIAARLKPLLADGIDPGDVAILVRAYSSAHIYANALSDAGIPALIVGGARFFELEEVAIMRALTRAIANPADGTALGELLASEFCPASDDALARLRLADDARRAPLWQVLKDGPTRVDDADAASLARLVGTIEAARQSIGHRPLADVLLGAVEQAGYDLRLLSRGNIGRDAFANVLKFARRAQEYEAGEGSGPAGFSAYLDARERFREGEAPEALADDGSKAVRIMSVHGSKGLEFPVVVVPDLASSGPGNSALVRLRPSSGSLEMALSAPVTADNRKPPKSAWGTEMAEGEKAAEKEESDRVLYVAFTRARDMLIASGSCDLRPKEPSNAKDHLHRLATLVGVNIPVSGPCDVETALADGATGTAARCRVRVVPAEEWLGSEPASEEPRTEPPGSAIPALDAQPIAALPVPPIAPERVSYTALSTFERCPRQYFVRYVLRLADIEVLEPGAVDPARFGSAVHAVLQVVGSDGATPSPERVAAIARQFELDAEQTARLDAAVGSFLGSATAAEAVRMRRVAREMPFALPISDRGVLLNGNIDLYARGTDHALIIDYKSGRGGEREELERRYELQGKCYALAALVDGCTSVDVAFVYPEVIGADGEPVEIRTTYHADDEPQLRAAIGEICERLISSDMPHLPRRVESVCADCPAPEGLCPNARPRL